MTSPTPYGPDRSLFVAACVLFGGGLVAVGAVYLLTTVTEDVAHWNRSRLAETRARRPPVIAGSRSVRRQVPATVPMTARDVRGGRAPTAPAGGNVPPWARSGSSLLLPSHRPARATYDLRADLSHAQIGGPPTADAPLVAGGEAGSEPDGGNVPLAIDARRSVSREEGAWRSELSQLTGRLRALDGALARLNREPFASGTAHKRTTKRSGRTAEGEKSAATSNAVPTPPGAPRQVPVDGGLGWLAAAGAAYAVRRLQGAFASEGNE